VGPRILVPILPLLPQGIKARRLFSISPPCLSSSRTQRHFLPPLEDLVVRAGRPRDDDSAAFKRAALRAKRDAYQIPSRASKPTSATQVASSLVQSRSSHGAPRPLGPRSGRPRASVQRGVAGAGAGAVDRLRVGAGVRAAGEHAGQARQGVLRRRQGRAEEPRHRRLPLRRRRAELRHARQPHLRRRAARGVRRRPCRLEQVQQSVLCRPRLCSPLLCFLSMLLVRFFLVVICDYYSLYVLLQFNL
jgi:hypothetical protein